MIANPRRSSAGLAPPCAQLGATTSAPETSLTVFFGDSVPALLRAIAVLRFEAWSEVIPGLQDRFPRGAWLDLDDDASQHWAVCDESGSPIAAARVTLLESFEDLAEPWTSALEQGAHQPFGPIALLSRVVVAASWRHQGWSTRLFDERVRWATEAGARTLLTRVPERRTDFLLSRHFVRLGPPVPGWPIHEMLFACFARSLDPCEAGP